MEQIMNEITLVSNCYEKNYKLVTGEQWAKKLFLHGNEMISSRILMISNISDRREIQNRVNDLKSKKIIDDCVFSYDMLEEIQNCFIGCGTETFLRKTTFREKMSSIKKGKRIKKQYDGLLYSISQMAAVCVCNTEWLLYVTEDVKLQSEMLEKWIEVAINEMKKNPQVLVANPLWNDDVECAKRESIKEDENFWYSHSFSDQCFLVNVNKLRNIKGIFAEKNKETEKKFPYYGGECFERRIAAYMKNHDRLRITYKHSSYIHSDITNEQLVR